MKKRLISALCAAFLLFSVVSGMAAAVEPRSSTVLSSYGISLTANGNKQITIRFRITAPQMVEKLGAQSIEIQKLVDGKWIHHATYTGTANPNFYDYDTLASEHTKTFQGEVGVTYKAILTAYGKGYDGTVNTRTTESNTATCT